MKNWLRKRLRERSTRLGSALVVVLVSIVGLDLSVEEQSALATAVNALLAALLIFMPDGPDKPADPQ
jgi:hypothetical protein